jgi:3-hydroxyisobutyryl-CoA hydrolase
MLHSLQGKSTPLVQVELTNTALTVSFNRTSALNALNIEMVDSLHSIINNATEQKFRILFNSSKALALTTGADILSIFGNKRLIPEFYKLLMNLVYKVHKSTSDNLAIMRGLVNAEGASLVLACKYRVATPSTVFGFPENGLGSVSNSGAMHFLSRLPKPGVGLYILLTGEQITGVDCYLFGLATHYIPSEENINSFLNELKQSDNPLSVLDKYHSTPSRSQSKIYENLSDIEKAYTSVTQIEDIYEKLSLNQTEFTQENVRLLNAQCPLSLKLSLKMFNLARAKNFKQCLSKEYDLLMQLLIYRNYNLTVGVHHKLIHKRRGIPPWNPDNLSNVTENMLKPFMKNAEGKKLGIR